MKLSSLLIVGIEIRMASQCMSLAGTMSMHKSYSNEKAMSTNACSLCVIFTPNSHEYLMMIDSMNSESYSSRAPAKSGVGIGVPEFTIAHNRASGFFVCDAQLYLSMVGWVGASKDAPGSVVTGTPTLLSSPPMIGVCGGEFLILTIEAAIMATIPAQAVTKENLQYLRSVTSALRYLLAIELNSTDQNNTLANAIEMLASERKTLVSIILPEIHRVLGLHYDDKEVV